MKDGLLLIDKPEGMTSHDVVKACRLQFGKKEMGHAGTLDPIATGLLIVLVGKATRLSEFVTNGDKVYKTTLLLGCETDTDDISGKVLHQTDHLDADQDSVITAMKELTGRLLLPVPIYSAVRVKGSKLYERARRGESFEPPLKEMDFRDIRCLDFDGQRISLQLSCTKGTYVRSWARSFGKKLGCGATVENLRRLASQPYLLEKAKKLDELEDLDEQALISTGTFIPMNRSLPDFPPVKVEGMDEKLISNGQISRRLQRFLDLEFGGRDIPGVKLLSRQSGRLLSIVTDEAPVGFKIRKVFANQ